ncbi:MAG TPA: hypothetical protein VIW24_17640 [Aldersonia sp.]
MLLVAGLALAPRRGGFEAILGALLAGVLVGFGLVVAIFFVTSGLTLDLSGLVGRPLALVPVFVVALVVRGAPGFAFVRDLSGRDVCGREVVAVALLQATALPFVPKVGQIDIEMGMLDPATGAGLVAAGLMSVLVFAVALALLWSPRGDAPDTAAARAVPAAAVRSPCGVDLDRLPNG